MKNVRKKIHVIFFFQYSRYVNGKKKDYLGPSSKDWKNAICPLVILEFDLVRN